MLLQFEKKMSSVAAEKKKISNEGGPKLFEGSKVTHSRHIF